MQIMDHRSDYPSAVFRKCVIEKLEPELEQNSNGQLLGNARQVEEYLFEKTKKDYSRTIAKIINAVSVRAKNTKIDVNQPCGTCGSSSGGVPSVASGMAPGNPQMVQQHHSCDVLETYAKTLIDELQQLGAASAISESAPLSLDQDPEKRGFIQQQLETLLHAHKCEQKEECPFPHCHIVKEVLAHITTCTNGRTCPAPHCASSSNHITLWNNCGRDDCVICKPLRDKELFPVA